MNRGGLVQFNWYIGYLSRIGVVCLLWIVDICDEVLFRLLQVATVDRSLRTAKYINLACVFLGGLREGLWGGYIDRCCVVNTLAFGSGAIAIRCLYLVVVYRCR